MVMQSFLSADDVGRAHFLESTADSGNFVDVFDQSSSSQGSVLSQDACPSWMPTHDGSADWPDPCQLSEAWPDPCWQSAVLAPDCAAAWGAYQQQQWAAAFLASSRSWSGMDPMSISLTSDPVVTKSAKSAKMAPATNIKWTEMALDPEKPTTPASKSRLVSSTLGGSDVKLPPPVGSGRQRSTATESSDLPKKLPFVASEGQLWEGAPANLNLPRAAGLTLGVGEGLPHPSPSLLQHLAGAQTTPNGNTALSTPSSHSSGTDVPSFGGSGVQRMQQHRPAPGPLPGPHDITTVMVRNVPSSVKQSGFVKELEDTGFGGLFDFCYLPSAFNTGKNKGYAFVNFVSISAYGAFVKAWHGSRRFNARAAEPALNVSAAALQGLERNIEKWDAPRMRRVRNPEYRPFVVKNGRMEPCILPVPSDDEVAVRRDYAKAMDIPATLLSSSPPGLVVPQSGLDMSPPPGLALQLGLSF